MTHAAGAAPAAGRPEAGEGAPTVVFLVSEDWYFLSHRLPMARAARDMGLHVIVATRIGAGAARIRAEGFEPVNLPIERGSLSPLAEARAIAALVRLLRRRRPVLLHAVAIKPIVQAAVAAWALPGMAVINSVAGMGSALSGTGRAALRRAIFAAIGASARRPRTYTVVQNVDDFRQLVDAGLAVEARTRIVPGSGVDLEAFAPSAEPAGPPVALCVTRLLYDKGLRELVEAARLLHARGSPVRVRVAGEPDPANPNSVSAGDLAAWRAEGLVEFLGRRDDVAALLRDAHMAILPSYREGLPKSLLEAAASGRALITTQTVGCRDLVPDGATGLLVPVGDAAALADALDALARDPERRRAMGAAARRLAEDRFGNASVGAGIAAVYREALGRSG